MTRKKRLNLREILKAFGNAESDGIPCRCGAIMKQCRNTKGMIGLVRRFRRCSSCHRRLPTLELPESFVINLCQLAGSAMTGK